MSKIDRFTTIYDSREDRIRLLIELTSGDVQEVWLTRRLLGKLIQTLVKKLETAVGSHVPASSKETAQRFSQSAAVHGMKTLKPVFSPRGAEKHSDTAVLVTTIGFRWGRGVIALDFKVDEEIEQTLSFTEATLRQWLGVVHSQYKIAKWSDDIWPSWMRSQAESGAFARLN